MPLTKPHTRIFSFIFFSLLVFAGCKKENSGHTISEEEEYEMSMHSSRSSAETEFILNDVFDNVVGVNTEVGMGGTGIFGRVAALGNERLNGLDSLPSCVIISLQRLKTAEPFPVRITIDFGGGCIGRDGHTRAGKIITTYSGRLTVAGNAAQTVLENFKIDSLSVEGGFKITNSSVPGTSQFTIDVREARLTHPAGSFTQWSSQRIITQTEGNATSNLPLDDAFNVVGHSAGKIGHGNRLFAWRSEITEPLAKKFTCSWISKGVVRTWRETLSSSSPWAANLDYGNGNCDYWAELSINGQAYQIRLLK